MPRDAEAGRRLLVLASDLPFPPDHGHKVDQLNRWRGFAADGWRLRLICWRSPLDPPAPPNTKDALGGIFEQVAELPINHDAASFARRLARLPRWPSHVAARVPSAAERRRLIAAARAFAPDAVVLDNIYGAVLGEAIAQALGVPVILRAHNVEHRYFADQARAARNPRARIAWTIARVGLARFENALLRRVAWTLAISTDEQRFWEERGVERISWAPTLHDDRVITIRAVAERRHDLAYIGNLRTPNNLRGLAWFVAAIWPRVIVARPATTLCIAGAHPTDEARALLACVPNLSFVPDAPSADAILSDARVLVNPILTGSGVNVKSLEMLRYDAPIVTTRIGVQGLPEDVARHFTVRDHAVAFAEAIVTALDRATLVPDRTAARAPFGAAGLAAQIATVERVIAAYG